MLKTLAISIALCGSLAASVRADNQAVERLIVLDEGTWQADNGRLSYYEDGQVISNSWFRDVNGYKLGDTPEDIIQVRDNLIAISVNWSNIIQFIDEQGKAVAATEDIPNNRKMATDGEYVYVTSYGHECGTVDGTVSFSKGFVAKIDATTFKVVKAVEVGYEPEGIALYKGKLFVANSGGYAFQEDHGYDHTVSVIDAATMNAERTVDVEHINLYGDLSQSGQFLCINSAGDYYEKMPATIILDCDKVLAGEPDTDCFTALDYSATVNCTNAEENFFAVGSSYSYLTNTYEFNYLTLNPREIMGYEEGEGVYDSMPGDLKAKLQEMQQPYGLYVNPYTKEIYATDAGSYTGAGSLLSFTPDGSYTGSYKVYINPGHFLALKPANWNGVQGVETETSEADADAPVYNLQGIRVSNPRKGEIYIRAGRKMIWR